MWSTEQLAWSVLRRCHYVLSSALICYACHSTSGRCKKDRSSFTLDRCSLACYLRHCDHCIYCFINLYRHAIGLCTAKANLCYTCLVGIAVQVCHFPKPNRPGAIERLVHSRRVARWEPDLATNHYHGAW